MVDLSRSTKPYVIWYEKSSFYIITLYKILFVYERTSPHVLKCL